MNLVLMRSFSVAAVGLVLLAAGVGAFSRAADVDAPQAESDSQEDAAAAIPQRVIVLSTGRVVLGEIVERPGGYLVREQFGSRVVPFAQVRLTATDLPAAYRKLSNSIREPTAGKHLQLAEWCYDNRLYDSAQLELKQALLLEPDRKDGRELLRKLQRTLETGVHSGASSAGGSVVMGRSVGAFPGQSWKSIAQRREVLQTEAVSTPAGLHPDTVEMFVKEVQPLLMNKCGNARCHGVAAENDFQLTPVRHGMSGFRILTEKNLSAVLQEIDSGDPQASPLLAAVNSLHAGSPRPLLFGAYAEQQLATLEKWVLRAAAETAARNRQRPAAPEESPIVQTSAESGDAMASEIRESAPENDPFLKQILDESRPDRFDPEVFNRLMHAGATPASLKR